MWNNLEVEGNQEKNLGSVDWRSQSMGCTRQGNVGIH